MYAFSGTIPKWFERIAVRQPIAWSSQDTWRVHTGKHIPDWCAPVQMGRSQRHIQYDCHLPHHLLYHDQDQWGYYPLDQGLHSKEKNAAEEWNSKYNSCSWWSHPLTFSEELCCRSSDWDVDQGMPKVNGLMYLA